MKLFQYFNLIFLQFLLYLRLNIKIGTNNCKWEVKHNIIKLFFIQAAEPPGTYYKIGKLLKDNPDLKVTSDEDGVQAVVSKNMAFIKVFNFIIQEYEISNNIFI